MIENMGKKVEVKIVSQEGTWYKGFTVPAGGWLGMDSEGGFYAGSGWECSGLYFAYRFDGQAWQRFGWVELTGEPAQLDLLQDLAAIPDLQTVDGWAD